MKRAVVLEIKEDFAAVLTDEGFVQKIRNENYAVGQEIELDAKECASGKANSGMPGKTFRRWYRAAAAAAAVFVISGSGLYYASENVLAYSTVTVTTENASLELTLNKKDEVVAVKALDEESSDVSSKMKISVRKRGSLSGTLDMITEGKEQAEISVSSRSVERKEKIQKEVQELLPPVPGRKPADTENSAETFDPAEMVKPEDAEIPAIPDFPDPRPDENRIDQDQTQNFDQAEGWIPEQQAAPHGAAEPEYGMPDAEDMGQMRELPGAEGKEQMREMPDAEGMKQMQEMPGPGDMSQPPGMPPGGSLFQGP